MSSADIVRPLITSISRTTPASSLRAYVTRTLPDCSPIVVSNRAPHEPRPEGGFRRGAGGVITGLLTLADAMGADWVAVARTDEERSLATRHAGPLSVPLLQTTGNLHYVSPTREQYDMYYSVFANPVLWFIQHYLWDLANEPIIDERIHQAWREGYVEVNRQIAARVVDVAAGGHTRGEEDRARDRHVAAAEAHRPHRSHRPVKEHRARLHRIRQAAPISPRAARQGAVLGVPAAVQTGRGRVQPLPAADPAGGRAHQQRVRERGLDADPPGDRRERAQGDGSAAQLRRAAGQSRV